MFPVLCRDPILAPFSGPMSRLDTFFDRVFGEEGGWQGRACSSAPLTMWADDDHKYVEADQPGGGEKDVVVSMHNSKGHNCGERRVEEGRTYLYNGRSFGRFERVITLPEPVDADAVQAKLANGVLLITCPKSPEARPKRITLQTS